MDPAYDPLFVVFIGLATGFVDSTVGSGGLISIPALMFLGLPAQTAIATDRFGLLGQTLAALPQYWKAKKIVWKYVPIFIVISIAGALIGAQLLLSINQEWLTTIIGIILLASLPLFFFNQDLGLKSMNVSSVKVKIGLFIRFLLDVFSGFFGAGTGPLYSYNSIYFFGFTLIESAATMSISWFVLSITSLVIFAYNGLINYEYGIYLLIGMTIGGYVGAKWALLKGNLWVKRLFIIVVLAAAIKLLLF